MSEIAYTLVSDSLAGFALVLRGTSALSTGRTFTGKSQYRTLAYYNPASNFPATAVPAGASDPHSGQLGVAWTNKYNSFPGQGTIGLELTVVDPVTGFAATPIKALCQFSAPITGAPFTIDPASLNLNVTPGSTGNTVTDSIAVTRVSGFTGAIAWSVTTLEADVTASFSSNPSVAAGEPVTLTFTATTGAAAGTIPVTVTATYGDYSQSFTLNLNVA